MYAKTIYNKMSRIYAAISTTNNNNDMIKKKMISIYIYRKKIQCFINLKEPAFERTTLSKTWTFYFFPFFHLFFTLSAHLSFQDSSRDAKDVFCSLISEKPLSYSKVVQFWNNRMLCLSVSPLM